MSALGSALARLFRRGPTLDDAAWATLEEALLGADVGPATARDLTQTLRGRRPRDLDAARAALTEALRVRLAPLEQPYVPTTAGLDVILTAGVNGAGKTTFVARLARQLLRSGRKPLVVGADTFRAGAEAQLARWTERFDLPLALATQGRDPAAVVFDALTRAEAEGHTDALIDTAGRLHSEQGLMDQLRKIVRVIGRAAPSARLTGLLVMDASLGRGAWRVARAFREAGHCDYAVITKLDSDARAGFALDLADDAQPLPIAFISEGAGDDAIAPFDARAFAEAMTRPQEG